MSGGDGRGHNTGAHSTSGNINGGPTGLGVGGGASDGSGWSSENNPWGGGSGSGIHWGGGSGSGIHWGGGSGSGIHWGGGSGHGNGGGNGNSGGGSGTGGNLSAVAAPVAFGFPALSTPGAGGLAISISASELSAAIAGIIAKLKKVNLKFTPFGVVLSSLIPSEIAKDDPNMMSKIVTSLPADDITESPVSSLPLDKATVNVNFRVVDDVKDEQQNISVVSGVPMSVPVVDAKPTERPGVFTASIPGAPVLNISVNNSTPAVQTLSSGITNDTDKDVSPAGFTQGGNTRDAVIRFPKDSGHNAVYVSVSDVLSPDQVKQRQDEENRRQQEWDATHPVEAAERNYERARAELDQANEDVARNQERQAKAVQVYNSRKSELDAANKTLTDAVAEIKQFNRFAHDPMAGGHRMWQMAGLKAQRAQTDVNNKQAAFDAAAKEKADADAALSTAMESRKKKEDNKRDAEGKLNDELEKNKGKIPGLKIDQKIRGQMPERGWTEDDIKNTVSNGATGTSFDKRSPKKTPPDYLGRNDPATVYGSPGKYVVVNDRTGEVTQISDKTDPGWVDDSRIQWGNKNDQ
ncbi:colicin-like bacteriocin tRNase domain-containing protein [Escherichia coli]|nr:S-type pyocin domain-containing protein [Escherichia coli]